jgi:hypothetical protein
MEQTLSPRFTPKTIPLLTLTGDITNTGSLSGLPEYPRPARGTAARWAVNKAANTLLECAFTPQQKMNI